MMEDASHPPTSSGAFVTTRWTRVLAARGNSPEARAALSDLCAAYYLPVVAFLRREGRDEDAARDLAHEFFALILERDSLGGADPARGRFRSYLLGALKHFLANRRLHDHREKRGGGLPHESLDARTDTSPGPALTGPSPDTVFDREWALQVIERALALLADEAQSSGTESEFAALKPWLTGDGAEPATVAAGKLGMTPGALRVAVHRLRRRFREMVKAEIRQTVADPAEVDGELRHLIASLG